MQTSGCPTGCAVGELIAASNNSISPPSPIAPPTLVPPDDTPAATYGAGIFTVNLTRAMPLSEAMRVDVNYLLVGFIFKIVDVNSSNVTYKWQVL